MKINLDLKEKGFYAIMAIGAVAGLIEGTITHGFSLRYIFPGAILAICAAFIGGLCGYILKDISRLMRGMKPYRGIHNDGMILGGMAGAFVGTLVQVAASADGANLVVGSVVGSFLGSMSGAIPDEFITPILTMMRREEGAEKGRFVPSEQRQ